MKSEPFTSHHPNQTFGAVSVLACPRTTRPRAFFGRLATILKDWPQRHFAHTLTPAFACWSHSLPHTSKAAHIRNPSHLLSILTVLRLPVFARLWPLFQRAIHFIYRVSVNVQQKWAHSKKSWLAAASRVLFSQRLSYLRVPQTVASEAMNSDEFETEMLTCSVWTNRRESFA